MYRKNLNSLTAKILQWLPYFLLLPLVSVLASCGTDGGADPGVENFPIAFVKRAIATEEDDGIITIIQPDIRQPLLSMPGGDVYLKERAAVSSKAVNITAEITNGIGDVKDLNVSSDGKWLIFSLLKGDLTPNDDTDNPTWNIYVYNRESGGQPVRVIKSEERANIGDDIAPYFLPNNNKIVFTSNRQKKSRAIVADEDLSISKSQFAAVEESRQSRTKALVLHVMDFDGTNVEQISFNQSHDLDPIVLSNGRILFSRWDNMNGNNAMSLYTILQDGSDLQPYYGTHDESHRLLNVVDADDNAPFVHFTKPKELPDGRIMLMQRTFSNTFGGGEIVIIDAANFVDRNQPIAANKNAMGTSASAVQSVAGGNVPFDGRIATSGRYSSFYPLNDGTGRMLVSKGRCQLEIDTGADPTTPTLEMQPCSKDFLSNPTAAETYPAYGIWLLDSTNNTEKPIELDEPGMFLSDAVVMRPYTSASTNEGHAEGELDPDMVTANVGLLNIRNIYDMGDSSATFNGCFLSFNNGSNLSYCPSNVKQAVSSVQQLADPAFVNTDDRPARFIRLVKAVGLPSRDDLDLTDPPRLRNTAFGRLRDLGMKEIIGYSPIRPDGSVLVQVPSDIAFYFEILDKDARRIGARHENWLQIKAGDTLTCAGCHRHERGENAARPVPHGRIGAIDTPMSTGALSGNYPNTQNLATSLPYAAQAGETMAETLKRVEATNNVTDSITPSVNVEYNDIWTDKDDTTLTPGNTFTYAYTPPAVPAQGITGLTTPSPNTSACETEWNAKCRTVINYIEHIQPIWSADRPDPSNINPNTDFTCTSCHARSDTDDVVQVPAGQLDLKSTDKSMDQDDHIIAYRELLFNTIVLDLDLAANELVNKQVQDVQNGVPVVDDNLNPVFVDVRTPPSMRASGARSSFFIEKMTETNLDFDNGTRLQRSLNSPEYINHVNMLAPAELRLISEWLDIGGQYFNNPFDDGAPQG